MGELRNLQITQFSQRFVKFIVTIRSGNFANYGIIVTDLGFTWPKYTLDRPVNIVFNASAIRLEKDDFRETAISLINQKAEDFGR